MTPDELIAALKGPPIAEREQAQDPVLAERERTHGNFRYMAEVAQTIKCALRHGPSWSLLSMTQREAVEAIATKLARIVCGDPGHADHAADLVGYAQLYRDGRAWIGELDAGGSDAR